MEHFRTGLCCKLCPKSDSSKCFKKTRLFLTLTLPGGGRCDLVMVVLPRVLGQDLEVFLQHVEDHGLLEVELS